MRHLPRILLKFLPERFDRGNIASKFQLAKFFEITF